MSADTTILTMAPVPAGALALGEAIRRGMKQVGMLRRAGDQAEVRLGADALWVFVRCKDGPAFAVRTAWSPGGPLSIVFSKAFEDGSALVQLSSPIGLFEVRIGLADEDRLVAHATVTLTPSADLLIPYWPRDLYVLGEHDDPTTSSGEVLASQRGFNAPIVFLKCNTPRGMALYYQNLTALNAFSKATGTRPDGVVTGSWPEFGYQPAVSTSAPSPPDKPLRAGKPVVVSDWILQAQAEVAADEREQGRLFLNWLALAYRRTEVGEVALHDWLTRAEDTLRHLGRAAAATQTFYGHRFVRPYLDAEPPDSMAQLAVVQPLSEYATWKGREPALLADLRGGIRKFWNSDLRMFGRYLPNVGGEKEADKVDSWYVYHPLATLGRLALAGDAVARGLFFDALPYAMRAARKFDYNWPVFFNARTLKVIQQKREENEPGQSDVGGIYAYVMMQAHEMDPKKVYLSEAQKALRALAGHGFDVEYQANLIAHGAMACLKCWRVTGDTWFRDESYHLVASFFHNSIFWESDLEAAEHYSTLLGASCLHNGPYMAMYECWDSCRLFAEYLAFGSDDIDPEVHFLLAEYCRRTPHRAWFYYPAELPEDVLCEKPRSGHLDRKLAFPLEDLYAAGDKPGTVGQEVYGCGAPWAFVAMNFRRPKNARFLVTPETPFLTFEQTASTGVRFRLAGRRGRSSRVRLSFEDAALDVTLRDEAGTIIAGKAAGGCLIFEAPQHTVLQLEWEGKAKAAAVGLPGRNYKTRTTRRRIARSRSR